MGLVEKAIVDVKGDTATVENAADQVIGTADTAAKDIVQSAEQAGSALLSQLNGILGSLLAEISGLRQDVREVLAALDKRELVIAFREKA